VDLLAVLLALFENIFDGLAARDEIAPLCLASEDLHHKILPRGLPVARARNVRRSD
jgi:hypothetical protein